MDSQVRRLCVSANVCLPYRSVFPLLRCSTIHENADVRCICASCCTLRDCPRLVVATDHEKWKTQQGSDSYAYRCTSPPAVHRWLVVRPWYDTARIVDFAWTGFCTCLQTLLSYGTHTHTHDLVFLNSWILELLQPVWDNLLAWSNDIARGCRSTHGLWFECSEHALVIFTMYSDGQTCKVSRTVFGIHDH